MTWAAEIDDKGIVVRVIVGDPEWARTNLGGNWVQAYKYDATQTFPGVGFGYAATHATKFAPIAPPGLEKAMTEDGAIPPDSLWWENGNIENIETIAARRGVLTAQEAQEKKPVKERGQP
jgi:hypothetical protein